MTVPAPAPLAGGAGLDEAAVDARVAIGVAAVVDSSPATLDTLNEIAAALGDDASFATTVTNALNGKLAIASDLSDLNDAATARQNLGVELGVDVEAFDADILRADTADTLAAGFNVTPYSAGTQSGAGTYTPDPANGNFQYAVNGGAHTLAPPASDCTIVIHYTNNGTAGTITTSGWTVVDGDALDTTDTNEFLLYCTVLNGASLLTVKALQ